MTTKRIARGDKPQMPGDYGSFRLERERECMTWDKRELHIMIDICFSELQRRKRNQHIKRLSQLQKTSSDDNGQ